MASIHRGAISFGLVHIPIQLYKTTVNNDISFHQLSKTTHERIHYKKYCANCTKELSAKDIVKGYEYEKDQYIIMSDDELDALKTPQDRTIHILHFTKLEDIHDIFYEKNYYAIPEPRAEKAYELLRKAMASLKVVAIAKTVIKTKETLLILTPMEQGILVKTLFYEDEIVTPPFDIIQPKLKKAEVDMAKQLIQTMIQPYDATLYHDEYQKRLKEAIMNKIQGKQIVTSTYIPSNQSILDLMDALTQSLANTQKTRKKRIQHS